MTSEFINSSHKKNMKSDTVLKEQDECFKFQYEIYLCLSLEGKYSAVKMK